MLVLGDRVDAAAVFAGRDWQVALAVAFLFVGDAVVYAADGIAAAAAFVSVSVVAGAVLDGEFLVGPWLMRASSHWRLRAVAEIEESRFLLAELKKN